MSNVNKFISTELELPLCLKCAFIQKNGICKAFPKGIPIRFLSGNEEHTKSFTGDHGIQFKPKTGGTT